MLIDSGFAYWKSGDNSRALLLFRHGLKELDAMQDQCNTDPVYSLQNRVGHTGMWVHNMTAGRSVRGDFSEPTAGFCSDFEPLPEGKRRVTPIDYILVSFVEFEEASGLGDELFRTYLERGRNSPYLVVRISMLDRNFRRRIKNLVVKGMFREIVQLVSCLLAMREHGSDGVDERMVIRVGEMETPEVTDNPSVSIN